MNESEKEKESIDGCTLVGKVAQWRPKFMTNYDKKQIYIYIYIGRGREISLSYFKGIGDCVIIGICAMLLYLMIGMESKHIYKC